MGGPRNGQRHDPREGIAASTFYDQVKAFFTDCADVLQGQGDVKGAELGEGQHALDAALACECRDCSGDANRDRAAESGACVAGHDHGLCDDREQAANEGRRKVLAEVARPPEEVHSFSAH